MTKPLNPLRTLSAGRPRHRGPAGRTIVAPLVGDLETRHRVLQADLVALLRPDSTLVLDLRGAMFLGAEPARLVSSVSQFLTPELAMSVTAGDRTGQSNRADRAVPAHQSGPGRRNRVPAGPGPV